jgi:hypothetical protein
MIAVGLYAHELWPYQAGPASCHKPPQRQHSISRTPSGHAFGHYLELAETAEA